MARNKQAFNTVRTEGAILPADLLQRIVAGDSSIPGLRSEYYHLAKTERFNEAATRAWNRLQGVWESFRDLMDKLPVDTIGTTETRDRWLLILFQELGYGRLQIAKAVEIEGKTYPISHAANEPAPIHLVSFRQELDRRTPGRAGAARVSPHSLVQEFLNRSDDHLWGFVSNGLKLRILRDNVSLTRAAYVEFDLQAMMDGDVYSDFFLLYMLAHQSRVEVATDNTGKPKPPETCWLEKWYNTAINDGVRALDELRKGVETAIETLGGGFLAHPANAALREKLRSGDLSTQDYYRQVLRQVYRLLFLFVAEDRDLLLAPETPEFIHDLYYNYYSTQRLRTLAGKRRGSRHYDQWEQINLVFDRLHDGCNTLGLPALGSFLFSSEATTDLNDAKLTNADLQAALYYLCYTSKNNVRQQINYKNLGPEELGSVYESLLEMHPEIQIDAARFTLNVAAGSERKTTGSYYTPSSLVNCLLDSALEPVIDQAVKGKAYDEAEAAILDLKVCDPACGSGHFLIAAAHRMAKRLAGLRAREEEPAPESIQHALRDIIGRCVYGVDINPMAVELCKISLWMEAIDPGTPLTFLDHHIQCGNSLLGTTPALIADGIPNDAFKPIEGDVREICTALKRENRSERTQGRRLWGAMPSIYLGDMPQTFANLRDEDDSTPQALADKERHHHELVTSAPYENARFLADAWCAAFVWPKTSPTAPAITTETIRRIRDNPHEYPDGSAIREGVKRLHNQYRFFHWHLAFADVFRVPGENETPDNEQTGWSGGFDVVLGNPPWERIKLQEKEFFAARDQEIADAPNATARRRLIAALRDSNPPLWRTFQHAKRQAEGWSHLVRDSGRNPLCGRGDINTYSIFAELKRSVLNSRGRVGCIVPSGIATDDTTKFFFQDLIGTGSLVSLYSFENEEFIFPAIHHATKFCLLTMAARGSAVRRAVDFVFFARQVEHLAEKERHFTLTAADIALINPNTRTCSIFRYKQDAELTKYIYRRVPVLFNEIVGDNPLAPSYRQGLFHSSTDAGAFNNNTLEQLLLRGGILAGGNAVALPDHTYLPFYEAKMVHQFDHRYGTYEGATEANLNAGILPQTLSEQKREPTFTPLSRYWVSEDELAERMGRFSDKRWVLAFRDIASAVVERTAISVILPAVGIGDQFGLLALQDAPAQTSACVLANINSFILDYVARQKLGGNHLKKYHVLQFPILPPPAYGAADIAFTVSHAVELTYTSFDLQGFAEDCGYDGPPFVWSEDRRTLVRAELDAAFFHLYLGSEQEWKQNGSKELLDYFPTPRHAVEYIMNTFRILRERDEAAHGCYRTKDTILEIYDELADATRTGQPYRTHLNPAPGPPCDEEGNFIPMAQWDTANWPSHIHLPKEQPITVAVPQEVLDKGQAILEVLALLHTWDARVDTTALTMGLILMRNDILRQRIARNGVSAPSASVKSQGNRPRVRNMDGFLTEYAGADILIIDDSNGMPVIDRGTKAPSIEEIRKRQVGSEALAKASEAVVAIAKIRETCTSNDACFEALGAENATELTIQ